ncbi:MAG: hypothetical protein WCP15_04140 [bacterium]
MTTISVPLTAPLLEFIEEMIRDGNAANKADVVRKALTKFREDEAVSRILKAEQEVAEGKILKGDLRELLKKIK